MTDAAKHCDSDGDPNSYTREDLIVLVRAVKFAHADYSIRDVHREISVTMANSDQSYAFLKDVQLNDVKKIWKKALKGSETTNNTTTNMQKSESATAKSAGNELLVPADGILKFYTVGDGYVKTLAENYANHKAEAAVAAIKAKQNADMEKEMCKYSHFFLDVPLDRSGSRPHQALINFQDNQNSRTGKSSKKDKSNDDGREIFKVQMAALPPGMEEELTPLLLYNSDRSARTFLHPPSSEDDKDDDGGYAKIRQFVIDNGKSGALGSLGGQKVSFWVLPQFVFAGLEVLRSECLLLLNLFFFERLTSMVS